MSEDSQIAIFFDLMGTCCDWLTSLMPILLTTPSHYSLAASKVPLHSSEELKGNSAHRLTTLALSWRAGFFKEIHTRFEQNKPPEDIDITHRRVLDNILSDLGISLDDWDEQLRNRLVQQWHYLTPWPDVIPALQSLRANTDRKVFLVVLANGTTRLQLDIAQSSQIPFHMLMSSELLGLTKPDPEIYKRAMELVRLPPERCVMLASHLYDLEAAKGAGMRTVYVRRDTEDEGVDIDSEVGKGYVDFYCNGRSEKVGENQELGFGEAAKWIVGLEL